MSEKVGGPGAIRVALAASAMTGAVFVGGGYFALTMLGDRSAPVSAPASPPVAEPAPAVGAGLSGAGVPPLSPEAAPQPAERGLPPIGPEGEALIGQLRAENGLAPVTEGHDMHAAGSIGYIPRITPEVARSEEALAEFAEKVPGLSAVMDVPGFAEAGTGEEEILDLPDLNEAITGTAEVRSAGRLFVGGREVAIGGIISPEVSDQCRNADGTTFSCGTWALDAWASAVHGKTAHCLLLDLPEGAPAVARCELEIEGGTIDIGSWAVTAGVALADQNEDVRYLAEEVRATGAARGLWSVGFDFGGVQNEAPAGAAQLSAENAAPADPALRADADEGGDGGDPPEEAASE